MLQKKQSNTMKKHTEIKQTAVAWLIEQLNPDPKTMQGHLIHGLLEQALEKEEEQIVDAWHDGYFNGAEEGSTTLGENYYADNYGFIR